jgi:hypothetical protein
VIQRRTLCFGEVVEYSASRSYRDGIFIVKTEAIERLGAEVFRQDLFARLESKCPRRTLGDENLLPQVFGDWIVVLADQTLRGANPSELVDDLVGRQSHREETTRR